MTASQHIVSGHHNGSASPFVVAANDAQQYAMLVDMLLRDPFPDAPLLHAHTIFYVTDRPVYDYDTRDWPARWLSVGYHHGFGGVFFAEEHIPGEDWAWLALAPEPLPDPPAVYFEQDARVVFPPNAVMPMETLRKIVLEWANTGQRPTSVDWLAVSAFLWDVTGDGEIEIRRRRKRQ